MAAMVAFEAALFGLGGLLILGPRVGAPAEHHGVMLGAAAGILFGVCNVAVKALTGIVGDDGVLGLVSPWLLVAAVASVAAFYASARGLQDGEAVRSSPSPAPPPTSPASPAASSSSATRCPATPSASSLQALAFVMVIVASALTPAPVRSAESGRAGAPVAVPA